MLNLIKRNLYFAPKSVKAKAYIARMRPIVEYTASCWSPLSVLLNHQLKRVQDSMAKFVSNYFPRERHYKDFSTTKLIESLSWASLVERREPAKPTMAFGAFKSGFPKKKAAHQAD